MLLIVNKFFVGVLNFCEVYKCVMIVCLEKLCLEIIFGGKFFCGFNNMVILCYKKYIVWYIGMIIFVVSGLLVM